MFGFVTPSPVDPPLNAAQISNKGIVTQGKFAYEFFLNPFMGVGGEGIFGYHYFIDGQVAANSQEHTSGFHLALLANFTFHLGFLGLRGFEQLPESLGGDELVGACDDFPVAVDDRGQRAASRSRTSS